MKFKKENIETKEDYLIDSYTLNSNKNANFWVSYNSTKFSIHASLIVLDGKSSTMLDQNKITETELKELFKLAEEIFKNWKENHGLENKELLLVS